MLGEATQKNQIRFNTQACYYVMYMISIAYFCPTKQKNAEETSLNLVRLYDH